MKIKYCVCVKEREKKGAFKILKDQEERKVPYDLQRDQCNRSTQTKQTKWISKITIYSKKVGCGEATNVVLDQLFKASADFFCVYWISQLEGLSTQCSQLTVKAMFTRLRKLQCFRTMYSCTAGFGWHGRQWVNKISAPQNIFLLKISVNWFWLVFLLCVCV